jgi:NAD(P)H-dependent flavin oxidoreductase YrpB (nitropropane dioxygenase family)
VLRTRAIEMWLGREEELAALDQAKRESIATQWAKARAEGVSEETEIIAGQDCGLIREVLPAAEVVRRVVTGAEEILGRCIRR